MSFSDYMKSSLGDYLLVLVSAWSCATVCLNGFFLDGLTETLGYAGRAGLACGVCAVLVILLFAATWNRRRMAWGVAGYVVVAAVLLAAAIMLSEGENPYADAEGNYLYLAVVLLATSTACFALSRTLAGSAVWFAASTLACSVIQAFYGCGETLMSMVCAFSGLALIVHRNFRLGFLRAESATRPRHGCNFAVSVLAVCLVGGLAAIVWMVVLAPADLGSADVKLITEYRRLPTEIVKGTAQERPVLNFDMKSDNLVDGFPYTTDDLKEDPASDIEVDANSMHEQQLKQQVEEAGEGAQEESGGGAHDAFDSESDEEAYNTVSYTLDFPWAVVVAALVALVGLAVVGYFVGRRIMRRRRLEKMLCLPPREQVREIYLFLVKQLERIGFAVPKGSTLEEWTYASSHQMDVMADVVCVPFEDATRVYERVVFGGESPSEDDMVVLVAWYVGFWRAARVQLGTFRYFWKSFRL